MTVSLCIIAYNEDKVIKNLLLQVLSQTYPHDKTEIVLVDSNSQDNTKKLFTDFCAEYQNQYIGIKVLENKKQSQAAGWNIAIKNAVGDIIIRLDAHAEIPQNFIENNVKLIQSGENVCGGARPSIVDEPTPIKEMLFLAENSMFGSSIAGYRRESTQKKYVSSLFHGAYRREVFEKVGGFNEDLGRTEDNELHYRIRQAGYKICQGSDIISYQHTRGTLGGMLKQKFGNGKWVGLTLGVCPKCLSLFHFVPFCFVAALILFSIIAFVGAAVGMTWLAIPLYALLLLYLLADLAMTVLAIIPSKKHPVQLLLPFVFFILHFSYGLGTVVGLIRLPFWKHRLDGSAQIEIENVRKCVKENSNKIPEDN